jgi:hypothetical protein
VTPETQLLLVLACVIAVLAVVAYRLHTYQVYVDRKDFERRFAKLPKIEGGTRKRF